MRERKTATADHIAEGRDGHVAGEAAAGEQHQRLHGRGGRGEDHAGSQGNGQAHSRRQGQRHHLQRRRHHHEAPRHRPPRRQDPRRHRQVSGFRGIVFVSNGILFFCLSTDLEFSGPIFNFFFFSKFFFWYTFCVAFGWLVEMV